MQRRLAAILAADIFGYSRLMGADEAAMLDALRRMRIEIFAPTVAALRGQIVKSMGDGWLVEFSAVSDAVNCALQVQDRLADHATIKLRIGVHIGDVTHVDEDIYGDGVNVASRLESIADPGGVAISDLVFSSLDGTLAPSFDDAGERVLKNIARPVRIWTRGARNAAPAAAGSVAEGRAGFPRLAIQPVATSDSRLEVRELAEALTGDLVSYLGSVRWLVSGAADEPDAKGYVLRAALRIRGERLRLEARMSAPGGAQLWAGKFDGDLAESFDWQDRTAEELAATLTGLLLDEENAKLARVPPDALTAEGHLLAGMLVYRAAAEEAWLAALAHYSAAIDRDPTLVEAYVEAIFMATAGQTIGFKSGLSTYFERVDDWIAAAGSLVSTNPLLNLSIAVATYLRGGAMAPLKATVADALRRAPFDVQVLVFSGWSYVWSGDPVAALACFEKHRRLGKFSPYAAVVAGGSATASVQIEDDEAAILFARNGLETADGFPSLHSALAAAYALQGRQAEAEAAFAAYRRLVPDRTISSWKAVNDYGGSPGGARYFEGLRRAGMPE